MNESFERSFGLTIAYLVPGFVCLAALSPFSPTIASWLAIAPAKEPTLGSFLYVILGSLTAGLILSAFRWAFIDTLLHHTGLTQPKLDFSKLEGNIRAFQVAVEHHYRQFQFFAGMTLAAVLYAVCNQVASGLWPAWVLATSSVVIVILFITSRDCLKRYYDRTSQILARTTAN